jgi:hypothetical protein
MGRGKRLSVQKFSPDGRPYRDNYPNTWRCLHLAGVVGTMGAGFGSVFYPLDSGRVTHKKVGVSLMGDLLGDPRQQKLPGGSL